MAKKKKRNSTDKKPALRQPVSQDFYQSVKAVLEQARQSAYRAVNFAMVMAYWEIGRLIVDEEQHGKERADYGSVLIEELSKRLTKDFGKGFTARNLRNMRAFYLAFPIWHALRAKSEVEEKGNVVRAELSEKLYTSRGKSAILQKSAILRPELSWTHYRLLLKVKDEKARLWYMNESADCSWSTRQLERQINSFYYERLLTSRDKAPVRQEAEKKLANIAPESFIKDPYVLEFLDIKEHAAYKENELERALLDKL